MPDRGRLLSDWFEALIALDPAAREAQLATLDPATAARLRSLLRADSSDDAAIEQAIAVDARAALDPVVAGMRIGPWRVLRELGAGGMGTVLLAEREQADFVQQVAIKLIRGFPSSDGIRRLRQERQILATLDHPNIARLIDGGETDSGQPYLVVEYVRGQTLDAHLRSARPTRDERLLLIERIGTAVQHAHQHLVIHRDLKPGNVMIRDDGEIKLLDFGVAKLLDIGSDGGSASTRVFTPGYASPEQRSGQSIGIASDVYSLGAVLRETLDIGGGAKPDAELAGIIAKATAESPSQRYVTVDAFCDDLRRYRLGLPIAAAPDTRWYRSRKFIARHRWATAATVLSLAVIAVLIWYLAAALQQAREQRTAADAARVETEQSLARSQAVIEFFAEMFDGVAPEHALGRSLAPSELLARAERLLRDKPPADASLRADLSTALGGLYQRLGAGADAVRLIEQGLAGVQPRDRDGVLELANRHLSLSLALFSVDRPEDAMAEIDKAVALRAPYAQDDIDLQIDSALQLAEGRSQMRELPAARAELDRARALAAGRTLEPAVRLRLDDTDAVLSIDEGKFDIAAAAARRGLALLEQYPQLPRTHLIQLERTLARALMASAKMIEAEAAFVRAIAAQKAWIGDSGARAGSLYNDYGILLTVLGRYGDAEQAFRRGAQIQADSGGLAPDRSPVFLNNLCDLQIAQGHYTEALRNCRAALALHAGTAAGNPDTMLVTSNVARAMSLGGDAKAALVSLQAVSRDAERHLGADSYPAALHTVRAVRAALLAGDLPAARRYGDRGVALFDALFPPPQPHPWHARALRARALVYLADGKLDDAGRDLARAHQEALAVLPMGHPLIAQVEVDQAEIAVRSGDRATARRLLDGALPILRACCSAEEIDRARGEQLMAGLQ